MVSLEQRLLALNPAISLVPEIIRYSGSVGIYTGESIPQLQQNGTMLTKTLSAFLSSVAKDRDTTDREKRAIEEMKKMYDMNTRATDRIHDLTNELANLQEDGDKKTIEINELYNKIEDAYARIDELLGKLKEQDMQLDPEQEDILRRHNDTLEKIYFLNDKMKQSMSDMYLLRNQNELSVHVLNLYIRIYLSNSLQSLRDILFYYSSINLWGEIMLAWLDNIRDMPFEDAKSYLLDQFDERMKLLLDINFLYDKQHKDERPDDTDFDPIRVKDKPVQIYIPPSRIVKGVLAKLGLGTEGYHSFDEMLAYIGLAIIMRSESMMRFLGSTESPRAIIEILCSFREHPLRIQISKKKEKLYLKNMDDRSKFYYEFDSVIFEGFAGDEENEFKLEDLDNAYQPHEQIKINVEMVQGKQIITEESASSFTEYIAVTAVLGDDEEKETERYVNNDFAGTMLDIIDGMNKKEQLDQYIEIAETLPSLFTDVENEAQKAIAPIIENAIDLTRIYSLFLGDIINKLPAVQEDMQASFADMIDELTQKYAKRLGKDVKEITIQATNLKNLLLLHEKKVSLPKKEPKIFDIEASASIEIKIPGKKEIEEIDNSKIKNALDDANKELISLQVQLKKKKIALYESNSKVKVIKTVFEYIMNGLSSLNIPIASELLTRARVALKNLNDVQKTVLVEQSDETIRKIFDAEASTNISTLSVMTTNLKNDLANAISASKDDSEKIKKMKRKIEKSETDIELLQKTVATLQTEKQTLNDQLVYEGDKNKKANKKLLKEKKTELDQLQKKIERLKERNESMENEMREKAQDIRKRTSEYTLKMTENKALVQELEVMKKKLQVADQEKESIFSSLQSVIESLGEKSYEDMYGTVATIDDYSEKIRELIVTSTRNKIEEAEKRIEDSNRIVQTYKRNADKATEKVREANQIISALEKRIQEEAISKTESLMEAYSQIGSPQSVSLQSDEDRQIIETAKRRTDEMEQFMKQYGEKVRNYDNLYIENESRIQEIRSLTEHNNELLEKLQTAYTENDSTELISNLRSEINQKASEIRRLSTEVQEYKIKIEALYRSIESMKADFQQTCLNLDSDIAGAAYVTQVIFSHALDLAQQLDMKTRTAWIETLRASQLVSSNESLKRMFSSLLAQSQKQNAFLDEEYNAQKMQLDKEAGQFLAKTQEEINQFLDEYMKVQESQFRRHLDLHDQRNKAMLDAVHSQSVENRRNLKSFYERSYADLQKYTDKEIDDMKKLLHDFLSESEETNNQLAAAYFRIRELQEMVDQLKRSGLYVANELNLFSPKDPLYYAYNTKPGYVLQRKEIEGGPLKFYHIPDELTLQEYRETLKDFEITEDYLAEELDVRNVFASGTERIMCISTYVIWDRPKNDVMFMSPPISENTWAIEYFGETYYLSMDYFSGPFAHVWVPLLRRKVTYEEYLDFLSAKAKKVSNISVTGLDTGFDELNTRIGKRILKQDLDALNKLAEDQSYLTEQEKREAADLISSFDFEDMETVEGSLVVGGNVPPPDPQGGVPQQGGPDASPPSAEIDNAVPLISSSLVTPFFKRRRHMPIRNKKAYSIILSVPLNKSDYRVALFMPAIQTEIRLGMMTHDPAITKFDPEYTFPHFSLKDGGYIQKFYLDLANDLQSDLPIYDMFDYSLYKILKRDLHVELPQHFVHVSATQEREYTVFFAYNVFMLNELASKQKPIDIEVGSNPLYFRDLPNPVHNLLGEGSLVFTYFDKCIRHYEPFLSFSTQIKFWTNHVAKQYSNPGTNQQQVYYVSPCHYVSNRILNPTRYFICDAEAGVLTNSPSILLSSFSYGISSKRLSDSGDIAEYVNVLSTGNLTADKFTDTIRYMIGVKAFDQHCPPLLYIIGQYTYAFNEQNLVTSLMASMIVGIVEAEKRVFKFYQKNVNPVRLASLMSSQDATIRTMYENTYVNQHGDFWSGLSNANSEYLRTNDIKLATISLDNLLRRKLPSIEEMESSHLIKLDISRYISPSVMTLIRSSALDESLKKVLDHGKVRFQDVPTLAAECLILPSVYSAFLLERRSRPNLTPKQFLASNLI